MIQPITNICALQYVRIADIDDITDNDVNPVVTNATWIDIPIAAGSNMAVTDKDTTAGRRYITSFEGTLKSFFTIKALVLIKVTLSDGLTYIIGNPDFPVTLESTHGLLTKSITFTHQSAHFPHLLSEPGSGSAGSGL